MGRYRPFPFVFDLPSSQITARCRLCGRLDAQVLDRLGRRLAGLGMECAAELARAQPGGAGQLRDRQRGPGADRRCK